MHCILVLLLTQSQTPNGVFTTSIREGVKNGFFTVRLTVSVYDSMCSKMDFTPEKSFSSNYKNSRILLTAAAALSQNGQIAV